MQTAIQINMSSGDDFFHYQTSFIDEYPWVIPVIIFTIFIIVFAIAAYCNYRYKHLSPFWRQREILVQTGLPSYGSTAHLVNNYPPGPYYPNVNNYPSAPPPYHQHPAVVFGRNNYPYTAHQNMMQK